MLENQLKSIFSNDYPGHDVFANGVLKPVFGHDFEIFPSPVSMEIGQSAKNANIQSINRIGTINDNDNCGRYPIEVFDVTICDNAEITRSRVNIQTWIRHELELYTHAFIIFHYANPAGRSWRLSYLYKPDNVSGATEAKRYTYLLGQSYSARTVTENFVKLAASPLDDNALLKAFSVQALSDEFFNKYREIYAEFVKYITACTYVKHGSKWEEEDKGNPNPQFQSTFGGDKKLVRDYVKKMFGRIVFLYFIQRKGWLAGNRQYMHDLFANSTQKDDFLDGVLEPLFFGVLNTDKPNRTAAARALPGSDNIPYLNGGLFEPDDVDVLNCVFTEELFKSLFDFLDSYNFTIDENDTDDAEVGIDPEMLGRIFENLLEDNKDKGAFYTPKEIVDYMCRESIIAYLQEDRFSEEGNSQIRRFVETLSREGLTDKQREFLRDKLKAVKICDPAIGSGAFPMGLVNLLSKLYVALGVSTIQMAQIKRHIIEQNIYGVDIEKGAVDIARLRFWLAMVVEEKEPMPLPNLHFKIMQGNSLLESYNGIDLSDLTKVSSQKSLFDSDNTEREFLRSAIKTYYGVSDHNKRNKIFDDIIKNVRRQLFSKEITLPDGMDPSANEDFFLWHTWFSDVFDNGGFDIVIGNPPYIQLQANGGLLGKLYEKSKFQTFAKTGDIYSLFYEKGWQILKQGGHLCFITSNKWMRAGYGEATRRFFVQQTKPELLIDFAGIKIFDNATVDTNILLFSKVHNQGLTKCVVFNKESREVLEYLSTFVQQNYSQTHFNGSDGWIILSPIEQSIKSKIEAVGTPLRDWDIQINYGIKTGFNDAFIITTEKRNEILSNCLTEDERIRTEELIRPILRGRDIIRYGYNWADLWLINTHNGIKGKIERIYIEDYPAVKEHLDQYWDKISKRADKGETPYNLRNCAYIEDFNKPKVMWKIIGCNINFCYDEQEIICNNAINIMIGKRERLIQFVGLMNSMLFDWYLKLTTEAEVQGGGIQLYVTTLEKTLVKLDFSPNLTKIIYKRINNEASDSEVNDAIFKAYNLTETEKRFIISKFVKSLDL